MTEPSYTLRDAATAVYCPLCFAEPGDTCCSEDGSGVERVHDERIEELRGNVRQAVAAYEEESLIP